jgi:hypothetical protein
MPLDLSEHEEVNSELNEFKNRVEVIAKRYAKQHRWCEVVDQALAEIGIEPTGIRATVDVQVTVQMPVSLESITDLVGKTPEEINEAIAAKMVRDQFVLVPARQEHGVRYLSTHDRIRPEQLTVVDINELEGAPQINGVPMGHRRGFTSNEGRVVHFVSDAYWRETSWHSRALCGAQPSYQWSETSERDENRTCAKCLDRATRL